MSIIDLKDYTIEYDYVSKSLTIFEKNKSYYKGEQEKQEKKIRAALDAMVAMAMIMLEEKESE